MQDDAGESSGDNFSNYVNSLIGRVHKKWSGAPFCIVLVLRSKAYIIYEGVEINQQDGLTADLEAVQPA